MIPATRLGLPSAPGTFKARRLSPVPVTATVDATGSASFTFPAVPADETWTGSIRIPGVVPSTVIPVLWSATDGGMPVAEWWNSQSSGPIQARTQLQVTGTGITVASALTAYLQGYATDIVHAPPWFPAPTPAPPPSPPQLLPQLNESVVVGTGLVVLGQAPVVVGTSISMYLFVSAAARIVFQWAPTSAFLVALETFIFDVRGGNNVNGLVLPNVGPFLQVSAVAAAAGTTVTIQVFTGLPPITQSPIVQNNVLWSGSGTIAANATTNLVMAPYFGPASFTMSPNNTAGFGIYLAPFDYQGNAQAHIYITQGWPAGTGPFISQGIIYVPAQLCQVVVDNSAVGSPTSYTTTGIALGP